jgi:hypothetical protein
MPGTSSANPEKLSTYSTDGLALLDTLRPKANEVAKALDALRRSSSDHVPSLGDADQSLNDLVGDWQHLDEFAGDVATGFSEADGGSGVVTVSDADILRLGHVGFADRDAAIAAAEDAQQRLDELLHQPPEDIDRAELDALLDDIARGQHDTAFAVAFSEAIGVDGYVDAMTLIENVYTTTDPEYKVTDQGLAYAAMLGTTLTTALATHDYEDPDNADLAPEDRLSFDFIDELVSGYEGSDHSYNLNGGPENPDDSIYVRFTGPYDLDRNLSVLMSYTDPPTWLAVDVANSRLSPQLNDYLADTGSGPNALVWGDRSGSITNYATMLGRNSDASTQWLSQDVQGLDNGNLELVLDRVGAANIDDGQALAQVVENGLTNDNVHESVPGAPSYVEGRPMREALMERAIDFTAEHAEINNDYLHGAFAAGVDANMSFIDERINAPFQFDEGDAPEGVVTDYLNTHDFLRETMGDPEAAVEIYQSVHEFGLEETASLPGDAEEREARLRQLGRIQGVVTEAETNAGVGEAIDELMSGSSLGRPTPGSVANAGIGWIPVFGKINDIAAGMNIGVGQGIDAGIDWAARETGIDWLQDLLGNDYDSLPEAQQQARAQRAENQVNRSIWLSTSLYESDTPQGVELRESAQGQPFVNADGSIKSSMTEAEEQAFRVWAVDAAGNDQDQGPIYTEAGNIEAGVTEVQQGDVDVRDRR